MDYKSAFGILSVIAAFAQYVPYITDILKGKTRPHAFSWFVWGLPCGIVFLAQIVKGGAAGSWATGVTMVLCTIIFVLSLFRGEKEITRLDWISLCLALLAIALWIFTKDPLLSVVLITVADVMGCIPTARKSVAKPHEETLSTYILGNFKWLLSLIALDSFSLATTLYPTAMFLANAVLVLLLVYYRKRTVKKP